MWSLWVWFFRLVPDRVLGVVITGVAWVRQGSIAGMLPRFIVTRFLIMWWFW